MKIGIICAMPEEIDLLKQDIQSEQIQTIADREFHIGTLYGKPTVLVLSRIGKVAAATTATLLIQHFHVDSIIFSGTAGGVDPDMNVGDAVVADLSCQHDMDAHEEFPFQIPLLKVSYLPSDTRLTQIASEAVQQYTASTMLQEIPKKYLDLFQIQQPKTVIGTIASGDEFVCTSEKNKWLYENVKNIKCVEMEGAAVAQVCYEFHIPFTVIRIISDCANDDSVVDFGLFIQEAARYFTRGTVKALLERM